MDREFPARIVGSIYPIPLFGSLGFCHPPRPRSVIHVTSTYHFPNSSGPKGVGIPTSHLLRHKPIANTKSKQPYV